jgi:hypothetical protein
MPAVKVRGELHCYNCGHVVARFEGEKVETGLRARLIAPANGPSARLRKGAPPRCGRCGGQVYLDEVEVVRPAPSKPTVIDSQPEESLFTAHATSTLLYRRF